MEYYLATERNKVLIDAKNMDDFWKYYADLHPPLKRPHIIWFCLWEISRLGRSEEKKGYIRYGKQYGGFLKKLKREPPCDPAVPLLGVHPKKRKHWHEERNAPLCSQRCNLQQPEQKQPEGLASAEWRRRGIQHADTRGNRSRPQGQNLAACKVCVDLEGVSLGDVSQTQKDKSSYWHEKSKKQNKTKLTDTENRWMVGRGRGWGMGKMGEGGSESTHFQL